MTKQQLIEDNMALVTYLIQKYFPTFLGDEDIFQSGMLGLCKAADTWDENKGTFSTYAGKCIINAIRNELRERNKHNGVFSLDYEYADGSDESATLKDVIAGQDDVDYVDATFIYKQLKPFEREILYCRLNGMTISEIAAKYHCSKQKISQHFRKMKFKIKY